MSNIFTPEIAEASVEVEVKTVKRKRVANVPPSGTRIRATLGDTVIYATVRGDNEGQFAADLLDIAINDPHSDRVHDHFLHTHLWYANGWEFEILDDEDLDTEVEALLNSEAVPA